MENEEKIARGLGSREVEEARRRYGANVLTRRRGVSFWRRFLSNLGDPVIKVLLLALLLHLILLFRERNFAETAGIAASILLATMISTLSEHRSESAFSRLQESCGTSLCRVRRGAVCEIPAEEVVVGDVVLLGAGERIPADGVLLWGELTVDQSSLTGESREVEKRPRGRADALSPEAEGALLAGCSILGGEGVMRVERVGDATYLGGISGALQEQTRESPLRRRLTRLAAQISRIGYLLALLCALAHLLYAFVIDADLCAVEILRRVRDIPFVAHTLLHALTLALTVVVVAVPEGLPMMIAVVLSSNIRRMVRDNVLVRKPAGLEAAGSMNILFTDKTGTLTAGKLTLCAILTSEGEYASVRALRAQAAGLFDRVSLCAHANSGAIRGERDGCAVALGGNSTDRALLSAFLPWQSPDFRIAARQPFDSSRKYAATQLEGGEVLITGAPEKLLPHVKKAYDGMGNPTLFRKNELTRALREHAERGERTLLLCTAERMPEAGDAGALCLVACIAFRDPLRPDAARTVRTLQQAGVQVVMLTGDSLETASGLARGCGILTAGRVALTGEELARMSDAKLLEMLPRLAVVARALPSDKSRLVRLCEEAELVVGMTGDGINDSPALRRADVGFAMGSGTQVAKEAGDVIILDDNLASICRAVLYGRTIFKSIRKFITLQLIMNLCAVGISILGPFIGVDTPVTVVQMLWVNLIMDTLGGLAFAGEPPLQYYMKEKPKRRDEPILTRSLAARIAVLSLCGLGLCVFFLRSFFVRSHFRSEACLLSAFFVLFIFVSVLNCFNARTDRVRMLLGLLQNRAFLLIMSAVTAVQLLFVYVGGSLLRTVPLTAHELGFTLLLCLPMLPLGWLHLLWRRLCGKDALY